MATRKGIKELEQEITCPICHDHFQEPKVLTCCHYYCKGCVEALARRAGANRPFACPECRSDIFIPDNDPDQLPTAFFVNRMKELYTSMKKAQGEMEAECELCTGSKATAFCRQCAEFICDKCTEAHHRMRMFTGHKVATLEELKQGGAKLPIKKSPSAICKVHDEHVKIYCYECDTLICRDCVIDEHAGHKYEFVKKAVPGVKQKLADSLVPLRDIKESMHNTSKAIESAKLNIDSQGKKLAAGIERSIQDLRDILEQHKQKMLDKTSILVNGKLEALTVQKKTTDMASGIIQSLVEFVERNIEDATEEELVSIHKQLLNRINEETKKHHKSSANLVPIKAADIVVEMECAEELKRCLEKRSKVVTTSVPVQCIPIADGVSSSPSSVAILLPATDSVPLSSNLAFPLKVSTAAGGESSGISAKGGIEDKMEITSSAPSDHNRSSRSKMHHSDKRSSKTKCAADPAKPETTETCVVCLEDFKNPVITKCGHKFCKECILKSLDTSPYCPICKVVLRSLVGHQPDGKMNIEIVDYSLSGYEGYKTFKITYIIPDGIQGPNHPKPGMRYTGATRYAYLPASHEGQEVLMLLQKAFEFRLIFTVGRSATTGFDNTVIWNGIHHKTNPHRPGGPYGYPDAMYLQRVKEDLAAKGIVPDVRLYSH